MHRTLAAALPIPNRRILQAILSFARQPCCCCSTQAAAPSLKTVLRQLYRKVHPDLFHGDQTARLANEHSFKLLQVCCSALLPLLEHGTHIITLHVLEREL